MISERKKKKGKKEGRPGLREGFGGEEECEEEAGNKDEEETRGERLEGFGEGAEEEEDKKPCQKRDGDEFRDAR